MSTAPKDRKRLDINIPVEDWQYLEWLHKTKYPQYPHFNDFMNHIIGDFVKMKKGYYGNMPKGGLLIAPEIAIKAPKPSLFKSLCPCG